jgi:hypothetical protein
MSGAYERVLGGRALMYVAYKIGRHGPDVMDYSVVLVVDVDGRKETVRVYGGAHGENELHRYAREGGKQVAEIFHRGNLGEGMRDAIKGIVNGYQEMIDGWHRT